MQIISVCKKCGKIVGFAWCDDKDFHPSMLSEPPGYTQTCLACGGTIVTKHGIENTPDDSIKA